MRFQSCLSLSKYDDFWLARLEEIKKLLQDAMVPLSGPGEIYELVRGPSYVYAILHYEQISNNEW